MRGRRWDRVIPCTPEPQHRSRMWVGGRRVGEDRRIGRDFNRQHVSGPRYITSSDVGDVL